MTRARRITLAAVALPLLVAAFVFAGNRGGGQPSNAAVTSTGPTQAQMKAASDAAASQAVRFAYIHGVRDNSTQPPTPAPYGEVRLLANNQIDVSVYGLTSFDSYNLVAISCGGNQLPLGQGDVDSNGLFHYSAYLPSASFSTIELVSPDPESNGPQIPARATIRQCG